ncbi:MAG: O-antigen ligase family protein [Pseudomonadota bacterium]
MTRALSQDRYPSPGVPTRSATATFSGNGGGITDGLSRVGLTVLPLSLFLLAMSGGFTLTEPAPYEFLFLVVLVITVLSNPPLTIAMALPVLFLGMNMAGALFAIAYLPPAEEPLQYVGITLYLNLTALVIAIAVAAGPLRMLPALRFGYTLGALGAALCGIAGYFNVAGLEEIFTAAGRASGPFADPNVFGPFLVFPAAFLMVDILRGGPARVMLALVPLAILTVGVLLSFSRGAWLHFAVTMTLTATLIYVTNGTIMSRMRVIVTGTVAIAVATTLLLGLLSVPVVGELFTERARIVQPYDVDQSIGRFNTQAEAIGEITKYPMGYGAYEFAHEFGLAPHNVYLKALTSNGWLGGFGYISFVLATIIVGFHAATSPTPWRIPALVAFATFVGVAIEGMVIDTDHWRHFYLVSGLIWGCFAAQHIRQRMLRDTATTASQRMMQPT